jgi:hypothetical protein
VIYDDEYPANGAVIEQCRDEEAFMKQYYEKTGTIGANVCVCGCMDGCMYGCLHASVCIAQVYSLTE